VFIIFVKNKRQEICELDVVRLMANIYSEGLQKGDCGRVVMIYGKPGKDADVEFVDARTGKITLVMVPLRWLEHAEDKKTIESNPKDV